jgi:two-component system cell cycle sensor histidine kinase/response regulator CckA
MERETGTRLSVLLVEDNPADARLVSELLKEAAPQSLSVAHAARLTDALRRVQAEDFSAILLDLSLPDSEGLDTFARATDAAPHTPVIVLTGLDDAEIAAAAMRDGAQDYLVKGSVDGDGLYRSIRYAVERHAISAALRTSESLFRQLADNVKEAFIVIDLPGRGASFLSRMWEEIWGRSLQEAQHDPHLWFDAIHPDDRPAVATSLEAVARGQAAVDLFRVVRPDGTFRWVRARTSPVFDAEGVASRVVGLAEDVTEVRRTEEQLRQAQKTEAIARLAAGIAHDFNNLLTAMLGYADLALGDAGGNERLTADIRHIRDAATSAAGLTQQLLAFSRRQILQPRTLDLNVVLRRVESLLMRIIGEDITLRLSLTSLPAIVTVDPGQIEQVVMNLAVNARDAMPDGGRLTIETAFVELDEQYLAQHPGAAVGQHVLLAVSDSGTGMDDATQKRLFEPFFTTKDAGKGTGLGLATVYGIVKQSGGSIWVYSELGKGSTFKIYLPATAAESISAPPARAEQKSSGGTETILIVEDQREPRSVVSEILRRAGYTVLEASNGEEAFQISRRYTGEVALLLTDMVMGGLGGRSVAEHLTRERPQLRVIYMSGYTDDVIVRHGVLEPGLAFLQKPFSANVLLTKVREVLDASEPPRT